MRDLVVLIITFCFAAILGYLARDSVKQNIKF